jgi:membrane protease YdiL (CAAX protease family)
MPQAAPSPSILRLAVIFYGALFAAALLVALATGRTLLYASPEAAREGVDPLRDAAAGALFGALVIALSYVWTRRSASGERLARALAALLGRRSAAECALLAALSGVAEEAFFRGALQPLLGLAGATAVFGLAHLAPRRDLWPWTLFALAVGAGLGLLFAWTGNLVAPVVAHVLVNAVNLALLSRDYAPA